MTIMLSFVSFLSAVSILSFPPVVSGNPGFYALSLMPWTGFPIRFPIKNVGNDKAGTTGMTEGEHQG